MTEGEREHLENVRLLNAALRDLVEENGWDLETVLRTMGAWLTYTFNSELLEEHTFRAFVQILLASYNERRPFYAS